MVLRPINHASHGLDVQVNLMKMYINYHVGPPIMPKGLKQTSSVVNVSARVQESAANTFTQEQVSLDLDPLNNEVFVVLACDINPQFPDAITALNTNVQACVSTTSRTAMGFIEDSNVIASASCAIRAAGFADGGVGFTQAALETPPATLEYIGIVATNDFFVSIEGDGNLGAKAAGVRLWGYRAKADASIYAALVQSEVLSA
tara:strand:+ start:628 stop:1236 length:609 start_codon:yes stop_codon:yes gene_type:complete